MSKHDETKLKTKTNVDNAFNMYIFINYVY